VVAAAIYAKGYVEGYFSHLIAFSFNFPLISKDFYKDKNRSAQIKGQNTALLGCGCGKVHSGAF
jgi:hypothetical protein